MSSHATKENSNETNINSSSAYFPTTPYNGYSIVDGLNAIGANSSYDYRAKIAERNGMGSYTGKPQENIR